MKIPCLMLLLVAMLAVVIDGSTENVDQFARVELGELWVI